MTDGHIIPDTRPIDPYREHALHPPFGASIITMILRVIETGSTIAIGGIAGKQGQRQAEGQNDHETESDYSHFFIHVFPPDRH